MTPLAVFRCMTQASRKSGELSIFNDVENLSGGGAGIFYIDEYFPTDGAVGGTEYLYPITGDPSNTYFDLSNISGLSDWSRY